MNYAKTTYGLDTNTAAVSVERSKLKAGSKKRPGPKKAATVAAAPVTPAPATKKAGGLDFEGLEAIKKLCEQYGAAQVQRLAGLFA